MCFEVLGHLIYTLPRIISSDPKSAIKSRVPLIFWGRRASPNGPFHIWTIAYPFPILHLVWLLGLDFSDLPFILLWVFLPLRVFLLFQVARSFVNSYLDFRLIFY